MTRAYSRFSVCMSSLCGIGYVPLMPGSAACVAAAGVFYVVRQPEVFCVITLITLMAAFIFPGPAEKAYGKKDDKHIVIDDFAGQLITFLFIPYKIKFLILGFFLFRMFDMLKVPPAHAIEKLPGSLGITGDDVMAGIYANIVLQTARALAGA